MNASILKCTMLLREGIKPKGYKPMSVTGWRLKVVKACKWLSLLMWIGCGLLIVKYLFNGSI